MYNPVMSNPQDSEHEHPGIPKGSESTDHGDVTTEVVTSTDGFEVTVDTFSLGDEDAMGVLKSSILNLDLGAQDSFERDIELRNQQIALRALDHHKGPVHMLSWRGRKVPRIPLGGQQIHTTQGGTVFADSGDRLGRYYRLAEFGGEEHDLQVMLVLPEPKAN